MARLVYHNCELISYSQPGYLTGVDCDVSGWIVETEFEAWRGLRYVQPTDFGQRKVLILDFDALGIPSTMRVDMTQMLFPLDVVYFTKPATQPTIPSSSYYEIQEIKSDVPIGGYCEPTVEIPLAGWLELNAGEASDLGWATGDKILFHLGEPGVDLPPSSITGYPSATDTMFSWGLVMMFLAMGGVMTINAMKDDQGSAHEEEYGIRMPFARGECPFSERPDVRDRVRVNDQVAVLKTSRPRDYYRIGTIRDRSGKLVASTLAGDIDIATAQHVVRAEYPASESIRKWLDSQDPRKQKFSPDTYADVYDSLVYCSQSGCTIDLEQSLRAAVRRARNG